MALLSSLLNIKPIVALENAEVKPLARVRNRAKGVEYMLKLMEKRAGTNTSIHGVVIHSRAVEEALALERDVQARFNCAERHPYSTDGPMCGLITPPVSDALDKYSQEVAKIMDPVWEREFAEFKFTPDTFAPGKTYEKKR